MSIQLLPSSAGCSSVLQLDPAGLLRLYLLLNSSNFKFKTDDFFAIFLARPSWLCSKLYFQHRTNSGIQPTIVAARILFILHLNSSYSILTGVCKLRVGCKTSKSYTTTLALCLHFTRSGRAIGLGSKLYLSNALSMLNKNLTRLVQSLSVIYPLKKTIKEALLAGSRCECKNT